MNRKSHILYLIPTVALTAAILIGCFTWRASTGRFIWETPDYEYSDHYIQSVASVAPVADEESPVETAGRIAPEPAAFSDVEKTAVATPETAPTTTSTALTTTTTAATTTTTAITTTTTAAATTTSAATAATAADPIALDSPAAPKHEPPLTISGINNETFLSYTTVCEQYKPPTGKNYYLYNFNTSLSAGFGVNGTVLPTEADYGIKGTVSGRTVDFIIYDHTRSKALINLSLQALDASANNEPTYIKAAAVFDVDTSAFTNGLYRVVADFADGRQLAMYFYINGNETWLCEQKAILTYIENIYITRHNDLMTVLRNGNVTPENSLSLEKLYYPFKSTNSKQRCDTQLWIDLSNTFINDGWSDEYKLYVIQAWIRENIAYDNFVSEQLNHSRAQRYMDLTGAQSVYDLRAGVCFDYVNIIAIMCRAHGIPAVTVGSESMNHVWNAVYVNNRWIEYDACLSNQFCVGEDTTVRTRTGEPLYDGIYSPLLDNNGTGIMPSDALANQYLQWDTNYLY